MSCQCDFPTTPSDDVEEGDLFLLAALAFASSLGCLNPLLRTLLAQLLLRHPQWMAERPHRQRRHVYQQFMREVLETEAVLYFAAMEQYAAPKSQLRHAILANQLFGWPSLNMAVAAALGPVFHTGAFLGILRNADPTMLAGYLRLIVALLDHGIDPAPLMSRRKPETLVGSALNALAEAGHDRVELTDKLPVAVPGVRALITPHALAQPGQRRQNCLGDPEWAIGTLLGHHKIAVVTVDGVCAIGKLKLNGEDVWVPVAILGEGNEELDGRVYKRASALLTLAGGGRP